MAFVLEDGTGVTGANAYVSVQEYRDYLADRCIDVTGQTDEQIQCYIVKGSTSLDALYAKRFRGNRKSYTQGLEWPRVDAEYDDGTAITGVPLCVKHAAIEFAYRSVGAAQVVPDRIFDEGGRRIKKKTQKVDVITNSIEYAGPGELIEGEDQYPFITAILCPVVVGTLGMDFGEPIIGGLTQQDIDNQVDDRDRAPLAFYRGQFDNNRDF